MTPTQYRAARVARGLRQKQLAALLGVTRETVGQRERGQVRISTEAALAIYSIPVPPPKAVTTTTTNARA